ncbi:hypothetical protein CYY_008375 [Polysphondylium violaceum]|uniref:Uncharacterized protein n=1 Tax=Polysphondylium violaceum TaxID=133409 RepID=A0A8J4V1B1_9MYCE|nr:hypothetical protein CYY_008375 [Polysphondylium violaceum]
MSILVSNNSIYQFVNDLGSSLPKGLIVKAPIVVASLSFIGSVVYAIRDENKEKLIDSNQEFQTKFNQTMKWLEDIVNTDTFERMKNKAIEKEYFQEIKYTLMKSTIGHRRPEALDNIKCIIRILTKYSDKKKPYAELYTQLMIMLNEILCDSNRCEAAIPLIINYARYANIEIKQLISVTTGLAFMSKDKRYQVLLADNRVVSLFLTIIDRINVEGSALPIYLKLRYMFALNKIINGIDETTLPNIDDNERELYQLCRQDKNAFWANTRNLRMIMWGTAFLFSLPAYSLPLTVFALPGRLGRYILCLLCLRSISN